jgi:hypothetical protein
MMTVRIHNSTDQSLNERVLVSNSETPAIA